MTLESWCRGIIVNCLCSNPESRRELLQKLVTVEQELIDVANRVLKTAGDPFSAVVRFLHERPENLSMSGYLMNKVLLGTFGERERIPGLIKVLAGHVKEVIRHSNVINIVNEHPAKERWGAYLIKQADRIKFEVAREKGKLVLKNIQGLICVEHGIEAALDKILVNPPKLEVTLRMGILRPQRTVDII